MSNDPDYIRRLTQSYRYLRGLEQIPLAVVVLGMWIANALQTAWALLVFVVPLLLAIPAMRAIGRYYDRRFGVVKAPGWRRGAWLPIAIAFFVLQGVATAFALPVQLGFLMLGVGLAFHAVRNFRLEGQRLLLAAFLVFISVWPPITVPWEANELWQVTFRFGFVAVWIAMAIWDHRVLVKAFQRVGPAAMDGAGLSIR
jgi:hypothetical protein